MKKNIFCFQLILLMIFAMSNSAFAAEPINTFPHVNADIEIERAINGISDIPITKDMKEAVQASYFAENENEIPLAVDLTVRKINTPRLFSFDRKSQGTLYALTAVASNTKAKSGSDDLNKNGIVASAYLTVYWIDNLGSNNELTKIEGSWEVESGTWIEGSCKYGSSEIKIVDSKSVPQEFTWNVSYKNKKLSATSFGYFKKGSYKDRIMLTVSPGIFD